MAAANQRTEQGPCFRQMDIPVASSSEYSARLKIGGTAAYVASTQHGQWPVFPRWPRAVVIGPWCPRETLPSASRRTFLSPSAWSKPISLDWYAITEKLRDASAWAGGGWLILRGASNKPKTSHGEQMRIAAGGRGSVWLSCPSALGFRRVLQGYTWRKTLFSRGGEQPKREPVFSRHPSGERRPRKLRWHRSDTGSKSANHFYLGERQDWHRSSPHLVCAPSSAEPRASWYKDPREAAKPSSETAPLSPGTADRRQSSVFPYPERHISSESAHGKRFRGSRLHNRGIMGRDRRGPCWMGKGAWRRTRKNRRDSC